MKSPSQFQTIAIMLTQPHYEQVGKAAANWATLELMIGSALWKLAQVNDHEGACLTAQIPNMARRIEALSALAKVRGVSAALVKKITKFGNDTHGLQDRRNRIVHDPWNIDRSTGELQQLAISAKGTLKFGYVPMPVDEIRRVVDNICDHINRFEALANEIFAELQPSPEKPE